MVVRPRGEDDLSCGRFFWLTRDVLGGFARLGLEPPGWQASAEAVRFEGKARKQMISRQSAFDHVDREAAAGGFLVFGLHIGAGLPHRHDDLI